MSKLTPSQPLGFLGAMCLLFVALKLTGHIDWSWWWVVSPKLLQGFISLADRTSS